MSKLYIVHVTCPNFTLYMSHVLSHGHMLKMEKKLSRKLYSIHDKCPECLTHLHKHLQKLQELQSRVDVSSSHRLYLVIPQGVSLSGSFEDEEEVNLVMGVWLVEASLPALWSPRFQPQEPPGGL